MIALFGKELNFSLSLGKQLVGYVRLSMIGLFEMKAIVAQDRLSMIALFVMKVTLANKIGSGFQAFALLV